jgi:hypothetical protein
MAIPQDFTPLAGLIYLGEIPAGDPPWRGFHPPREMKHGSPQRLLPQARTDGPPRRK